MGFIEIKQEMIDGKLYQESNPFFVWVKTNFQTVAREGEDITAKSFAFHLLDYVVAPGPGKAENPDEVFKGIISHAKTLGIEPWSNFIGLRLQASACLAQFIEME